MDGKILTYAANVAFAGVNVADNVANVEIVQVDASVPKAKVEDWAEVEAVADLQPGKVSGQLVILS